MSATRYGAVAMAGEVDRVSQAGEGGRHRTIFAAAARLGELAAGGEVDAVAAAAALERAAVAVGLSRSDAARHVRRGMERGGRHPRRASQDEIGVVGLERIEVLARITGWWEAASATPRPGRAGAAQHRILSAFFLLAVRAGRVELDDSLRQIAEAAGVSHECVRKNRSALAPWVIVASKGNRTGARHRWRLNLAAGKSAHKLTGQRPSPTGKSGLSTLARLAVRGTLTDPAHDHWGRWSGGWRLFCALDLADGATASELAVSTGASVGGTRRNLRRLEAEGLAIRDGDGAWRLGSEQAQGAEVEIPHAARRRQRHRKQREDFRAWQRREAEARERRRVRLVDAETGEIIEPGDHREVAA